MVSQLICDVFLFLTPPKRRQFRQILRSGSLLLIGFCLFLFLLPPFGHKPPPPLGDYFGPALGVSGCMSPVPRDAESSDVTVYAGSPPLLLTSPSLFDTAFERPNHHPLRKPSVIHADKSSRPHQSPRSNGRLDALASGQHERAVVRQDAKIRFSPPGSEDV